MNPKAELQIKLARVRELIASQGAEAALVGLQPNFSWLACGGEAHIPLNSDRAFGQLVVTGRDFYVFANRIEMPRLEAEVVRGLGAKPILCEWHDEAGALARLKTVADPGRTLSDCGDWGTKARPGLFAPLHYSLLEPEVARYRELCRDSETAIRRACHKVKPGMTEFQIAGVTAAECWRINLTPVVLLVAADERLKRFRHSLPTTRKLERIVMLVLCARRHGLISALTRLVHFGKLPGALRQRHRAVCAVDASFHLHTRVGTPVRDVFRHGVAAYKDQGFAREWILHHQGGPCGYQGRDYLGSPSAPGVVLENQPYAWNPSITGTKSEDTIMATAKGPVVMTPAVDWPMVEVETDSGFWPRPDILVR